MSEVILTAEQNRQFDKLAAEACGISGLILMENAGRGVAESLLRQSPRGPVLICCGKGNNGGDGFVIARQLSIHRIPVRVVLWAEPEELKGDAATNFEILRRCGLPWETGDDFNRFEQALSECEWVVDCLLGTGVQGDPRPPFDQVIDAINRSKKPVFAVDVPSGLNCDTGEPSNHAIRAKHTCTFVANKPGYQQPAAQEFVGGVEVISIGTPPQVLEKLLARNASNSG